MGILISNDGSVTLPCALLVFGVPLLAIGKHRCNDSNSNLSCPSIGISFSQSPFQWSAGLIICFLSVVCVLIEFGIFPGSSGKENKTNQDVETELLASHYQEDEILELAKDNIIRNSQLYLSKRSESISEDNNNGNSQVACVKEVERKAIVYLNAFAFKVSKQGKNGNANVDVNKKETALSQLYLTCQEVAYKSLSAFPSNDKIIASALSLLALIAKHSVVRERNIFQADVYGINIPIQAMRESLKRSKIVQKPNEDDEVIAAELQRKACLYLGALADGAGQDDDIATKIVEEDGLDAVIDAIAWYRCHAEVVNWGMFAIFTLCFEHTGNKKQFVRMDGIEKTCRAMKVIMKDYHESGVRDRALSSSSKEVARHGIAILFDILRYDESNPNVSFAHIRRVALNAGLHDTVKSAMLAFGDNTEIMMMGQQMLIATGYAGDIPEFAGSLVPKF